MSSGALGAGRRIGVRPTAAAYGFLALALANMVLAINFTNNQLFALSFVLFSVLPVAYWRARDALSGLAPGAWRVANVFAGESAIYRLELEERLGQARIGVRAAREDGLPGHAETVPGHACHELAVGRPAPARGALPPQRVWLESLQPFGLFRSRLALPDLPGCLAYPLPKGPQALPLHDPANRSQRQDDDVDFAGLRPYQPGDSPQRIAWKALARSGDVMTKRFEGRSGHEVLHLRWDAVAARDGEMRLSQLTAWVLEADRLGGPYGLTTPLEDLAPDSGPDHRYRCLKHLASFDLGRLEGPGVPGDQA